MGAETTRALIARRRESAERITRLVAQAEEHSSAGAARRHRITQSLRLARWRLRALVTAQRTASALELEIGELLIRVEAEGMSRNEVFRRVGLTRHVGRKYVAAALAAQDRPLGASSTDPAASLGVATNRAHLGSSGTRPGAIDERKR